MTETLRHKDAFEFYYALGEKRSYKQVAERFGTSKTTVYNWANRYNWAERIEQRDIEIARQLEQKTNTTITNEKARYRTIIKRAIHQFAKKLDQGDVDISSVNDLDKLIKLDLLLMGEPTERTDGKVNNQYEYDIKQQIETDPESRELLKQLWRRQHQ